MNTPATAAVEPLTRRERDVLRLLAQGHSAPEIAQALTLALSTVKFHLDNLYGKLGANTKRQALDRARACGLLAGDNAATPAPKHNLPLQSTRFFGRTADLTTLHERLAEWRLVSLTGAGGVGKTRLALRYAEAHLEDFAQGVWLVELAPLSQSSLVPQTVAMAVGVRDIPGRPMRETLVEALRERQMLLLLDNCEHVLDACAELAEALLGTCPHLKILATSREAMAIAGEAVLPVPPLPFPDPQRLPALAAMAGYDAISFFLDRVRAHLPGYRLEARNAGAVARICQRLDGIPLALEMAASRLSLLTAEQLATRLDEAFRLLTNGSRTALPRQQTLRATLEWSYHLLGEPERLLLQRLSIFAGGCTLEAAEAVCSDDDVRATKVLDHLAALVAKSLVLAERQPGAETRYRLLEMVRQYAREKLQDAGETEHLSRRHRDHYLAFAEFTKTKLNSSERPHWERLRAADRDNLRRAMDWSFSDPTDVEAGPRLLLAMAFPWDHYGETLTWFQRGVAWCQHHTGISDRLAAKLFISASMIMGQDDPPTAVAWAEKSVELSQRLGPEDQEMKMWSLYNLGNALGNTDEIERGQALVAEAEAMLQALGPSLYAPVQYLNVRAQFASLNAELANRGGQHQAAKQYAQECLRLSHEADRNSQPAFAWVMYGIACVNLAEYDNAGEHLRLAARLVDNGSEPGFMQDNMTAYILRWLADLDIRQGKLARAVEYCQASLRHANNIPDYNIIASALGLLASLAARATQRERAATLSGASQAMYARQKRTPWEDSTLDTLLPGWQSRPEHAALADAFAAGQAFTNDQAIAYALEVR